MGFRCSILGCEYERAEPEREREQRGEEVIHTVREYEQCTRCGDRRLVSENTGVTAAPAVQADGSGSDPFAEAAPEADLTVEVEHDPAQEEFDDDFVETDLPDGSSYDPDEEDDAVILGDDGDGTAEPEPASADEPADPEGFYDDFDGGPADEDDGVEFLEAEGTSDPVDAGGDPDPEPFVEPEPEETTVVEADDAGPEDGEDAVFVDGAAAETPAQADARTGTDADADDPEPDQGAAFVDGAPETEPDASAGEFGEWPDQDPADEPEYDHGAWPDPTDAEDEGFDATPASEESTESDAPLGADSDVEFSGLAPENGPEEGHDAEFVGSGGESASQAGAASAGVAAESGAGAGTGGGHDAAVQHGPGAQTTRTDVAGELFCEACGFSGPPSDTPHRAGDLCPGCGSNYLAER